MMISQRKQDGYFEKLTQILLVIVLVQLFGCSKVSEQGSKGFDPDAYLANEANKTKEFTELLEKAKANDVDAQVQVAQKFLKGDGVTKDEAQAQKWFESAAEKGNGAAQYFLGEIYEEGLGVPKDAAKAFSWYEKSAAQDTFPALSALARCYYLGNGTISNVTKAVEYWEKAAAKGDLGSKYSLGYIYLNGASNPKDQPNPPEWDKPSNKSNKAPLRDFAKAFSLFESAADKGYSPAQYALGTMFRDGLGIPKDLSKAIEWFQKSAAGKDENAQYELGRSYFVGNGAPKDYAKAAEWIHKAAIQGHIHAQAFYGYMLSNGEGIPKDKVLAYAWSNIAAANGDKDGIKNRDIFELQLSRDEKLEAQELSSSWKKGMLLSRWESVGQSKEAPNPRFDQLTKQGTGTGFLISKSGLAVTNHHVIAGCKEVRSSGVDGIAKVKASDMVNDLALIAMPNQVTEIASLHSDPSKLRQGDDVVVFGFPLNTVLSSGGNLTPGVVSALTGLGNNTSQIQITAAIQPGSSGSPVINKKGEVIAVVSNKLSDSTMAKATGQVAQSVNFAVGGQTLQSFLTSQGVEFSSSSFRFFEKSTADLADEARKWTILLECWK